MILIVMVVGMVIVMAIVMVIHPNRESWAFWYWSRKSWKIVNLYFYMFWLYMPLPR